ncbi:condensation domain-containing protein, partial [Rhodococcus sp. ENV425]
WQRDVLGSEGDPDSVVTRQLEYWKQALDGLPDGLDLPTDRPRPAVATNRGATHRLTIDESLHAALGRLAGEQRATVFMVVHATLALLLARLGTSRDIAVGTPVAGRGERSLDNLIGMFVNTLVLRTEVDTADTFAELLARVREVDLGAFAHAEVPFERLVDVLAPERTQARTPLFQVMLAFQNIGDVALELPGLSVAQLPLDAGVAKFDLMVTILEGQAAGTDAGDLAVEISYATDLFDAPTVAAVGDRFVRLL